MVVTKGTGLDRLLADPALIPDRPTLLCANYTSVAADLTRGLDGLVAAGIPLVGVLTPEHGYWGAAQAGDSDGDGRDERTGVPLLDTYRLDPPAIAELIRRSEAEQILLDLQDIGTRFYTYMWTMYDVLCAAQDVGIPLIIADRPNPLGPTVQGPGLEESCSSFVGRVDIPLRHGLTIGELGTWFARRRACADLVSVLEARPGADDDPLAPERWVMPSPNIPTPTTAVLYPGLGLIEGTSLSEGRGTTRPFELIGAPWTDARLAAALRERQLPGVEIREAMLRPMFSKHSGLTLHGVQIHVIDPAALDPLAVGFAVIDAAHRLYPEQPIWREQTDLVPPRPEGHPPFIDLLWGSPALRHGIDAGKDLAQVLADSPPAPSPQEDLR